jgi:F-type H+-transporting ATPase subunit b
MLKIDFSLFVQIANFLLLLLLMNIFLFKPIRKILARRKEEINSLEGTIEGYQNRSDQDEKGIEEGTILARKEGHKEKENLKGQGLELEKGVLQKASSSAEEKIGNAKQEIENKIGDVRKALEDQVASFSEELAEKILGRSIQ